MRDAKRFVRMSPQQVKQQLGGLAQREGLQMSKTKLYKQTLEYSEGRSAYCEGERRAHNPYASGEKEGSAHAWWLGWDDEDAAQQARVLIVAQQT